MTIGGWRIGAPEDGFGFVVPSEVTLSADLAIALAIVLAALILRTRMKRATALTALSTRLASVERGIASLDRVSAITYELEDRYGKAGGAAEADIPAILDARRQLAQAMVEARACLEAYGDLSEPSIAEDAVLIAMRPVVEHPPSMGEGARSLERLRTIVTRLRFEAGELRDGLRKRLGYRPHGARVD